MLRYPLLHPELLAAVASAGHGAQVLVADANFPYRTAAGPNARLVYLNLRPGMVTVEDVVETLLSAIAVEAVHVMTPEDNSVPEIYATFERLLPGRALVRLGRNEFYGRSRGADVAVVVATGDQRLYANILLTIGLVTD